MEDKDKNKDDIKSENVESDDKEEKTEKEKNLEALEADNYDEQSNTDEQSNSDEYSNTIPKVTFESIFKETFGKFFVWNARTTRATYWLGILFSAIASLIFELIAGGIIFFSQAEITNEISDKIIYSTQIIYAPTLFIVIFLLLVTHIYLFMCELALGVRRLHDINKSGWWMLIQLIPVVGWIWFIVLMCTPSNFKDNKWKNYLINYTI